MVVRPEQLVDLGEVRLAELLALVEPASVELELGDLLGLLEILVTKAAILKVQR